jgi:phthiocerol/phenolphthiocerol synthesis type-I polyketide synthase D
MTASLSNFIIGRLSEYTGVPVVEIDATRPFEAIGLQSPDAVVLAAELGEVLGKDVEIDLFLRCSTVGQVLEEIAHMSNNESAQAGGS